MPGNHGDSSGVLLVSGDAVELDIRLARVGSRMLARLIDLLAQAALLILLSVLFSIVAALSLAHGQLDTALVRGGLTVIVIAVFIGYPAVIEAVSGGRSLGKLAMGLRVIRDDGGPVRWRHTLTRALVGVAVGFPGILLPPLTWAACLWTMLVNGRGKRLGDLAAGTVVVHDRSPATWGWVPAMPPALAAWALTLDLTGLPDELALSIRHFLARNRQIREPARTRLGHALASELAAYVTPQPPPGTPGWAYLAAVLAERNRRSALRLARARQLTARVFPQVRPLLAAPAWPPAGTPALPSIRPGVFPAARPAHPAGTPPPGDPGGTPAVRPAAPAGGFRQG